MECIQMIHLESGTILGQLVVFKLDEQRYALPLDSVKHVVNMVEITHLPKAPEIVRGIIDVHGEIVPVVDIRRRFAISEKEAGLDDRLLIARTLSRNVAIVVDDVTGLIDASGLKLIEAEKIVPGIEHVAGVVKLEDGMVLIHDIDKFLSLDEEKELAAALKKI